MKKTSLKASTKNWAIFHQIFRYASWIVLFFLQVAFDYVNRKYPQPWSEDAEKLGAASYKQRCFAVQWIMKYYSSRSGVPVRPDLAPGGGHQLAQHGGAPGRIHLRAQRPRLPRRLGRRAQLRWCGRRYDRGVRGKFGIIT